MKGITTIFSSTGILYGLIAVAITAVMVFAVLPQLPQVDTAFTKVSTSAKSVFAFGTSGCGGCDTGTGVDKGGDKTTTPLNQPASCDSFTASPKKVPYGGGNVTLNWETTNAYYVNITGVGNNLARDGSKTVRVNRDTTFTMTVIPQFHHEEVTCTARVTVEQPPVDEPARCDFLTANKTSLPYGGGNVTLSWGTTNATSVSINNGVGTVSADGSKTVAVNATKTFTLTAIGAGGNDTCTVKVTVKPPVDEPEARCDFLTANKTSLPENGGNVVLSWGTTNADSVSINNGIGSVADDGSRTVFVDDTTTFTLTATNTKNSDSCAVTITVDEDHEKPRPRCDYFTVSDDDVEEGDEVTLRWATTNANDVRINQGIGSVSNDGSKRVRVYDDTTFVLTAENGNYEDTCSVRVNVDEDDDDDEPRPRCELTISDRKVKIGDEVTLEWETRDADEVTIEDDRGRTIFRDRSVSRRDDGDVDVIITRDTEFTLIAEGDGGKRECDVDVEVEDGEVLVLSERDQGKVAGISLTQVPYTGFEAGPVLTFLFYTLLALWAFAVAYFLVIRKNPNTGFRSLR